MKISLRNPGNHIQYQQQAKPTSQQLTACLKSNSRSSCGRYYTKWPYVWYSYCAADGNLRPPSVSHIHLLGDYFAQKGSVIECWTLFLPPTRRPTNPFIHSPSPHINEVGLWIEGVQQHTTDPLWSSCFLCLSYILRNGISRPFDHVAFLEAFGHRPLPSSSRCYSSK